MTILSKRHQFAIGFALVALTVATRGHHLPTLTSMLPSASWAVFFLAGVYLRPAWFAGVLLALSAAIDYIAITVGGVNAFCVSPAYAALVPAYASLWLAGRWYSRHAGLKTLAPLALALSASLGTLACELISSGSFYVFSGRFATTTLAEFTARFSHYFPASLTSLALWVAVAAIIHGAVLVGRGQRVLAAKK